MFKGTNYCEFGELGQNSPKLVLAKIKYFLPSPKLIFFNFPKLPPYFDKNVQN